MFERLPRSRALALACALPVVGCADVVLATKKDPTSVYRAYDGSPRPAESVALLYAGADTWIRAFDGRALADIRLGVFFELLAGRHALRLRYEAPPSLTGSMVLTSAEPLDFDFEGGRAYRLRWERRDKILWPVIEPHPEPLPALARKDDPPCWYDAFDAEVVSFVWGKTMRERLKQTPKLTLKQPGSDEARTWSFSSLGVFQRPAGKMQEMASNWNADGTFHGYLIGTKPLVPGRHLRALVSTCRPEEIREVILE
jgi:hypothetical protein